MRAVRCRNLRFAGIDIHLPALISIDGRKPETAEQVQVAISIAVGHVEDIVAPLTEHWLEHCFQRPFVEDSRLIESGIAAAAFYDKLASCFTDETPLVAALMFPRQPVSAVPGIGDASLQSGRGAASLARCRHSKQRSFFLAKGTDLAKWTFCGRVRSHISPATGVAQVTFDEIPGGIALASAARLSPTPAFARPQEISARYGFGTLIRSPTSTIMMLRKTIAAGIRSRLPAAHHV